METDLKTIERIAIKKETENLKFSPFLKMHDIEIEELKRS